MDLGESFPTSIYLQNLASIQPRTNPLKFARSSGAASLGGTLEALAVEARVVPDAEAVRPAPPVHAPDVAELRAAQRAEAARLVREAHPHALPEHRGLGVIRM